MNTAEAQKKGKILKAFDNVMWASMLVIMFGSLFVISPTFLS